jgi:hypothetical protein
MTVELTVEAPDTKTREEVEGAAFWLLQPFLDEATTDTYNVNGCQVKEFNIEINN